MSNLEQAIEYLKGVGEKRAKAFNKLGIFTVGDLISHYPRRYEDRTLCVSISEAPLEQFVCIKAMVAAPPTLSRVRGGLELVKLRGVDDSGSVDITFFNQAYIRHQLLPGETYVFFGKTGGTLTHKSLINPDFEKEGKQGLITGCIMPVYKLSGGISNKHMISCMRNALCLAESEIFETLPITVIEELGLARAKFSIENIHFPSDYGCLELARRRLIFEEFFTLSCAMSILRDGRQKSESAIIAPGNVEEFYATLPFAPTAAQRSAAALCFADMKSGSTMSRLIQGDVGSGKTLVAASCIWACCKAGYQAAFMVPTDILARQHINTLKSFLDPFGIRCDLLTGSLPAKERREVKARLKSGETGLVIGTHAILSKDVEFSALALVIADEQHRFGVSQRGGLLEKGKSPHILVMSATPIPRTLALMMYGELDVSIIDEMPPGRQKVDTFSVGESYRKRLNAFIEKQVSQGHQVFVVCPKVEDSGEDFSGVKNATAHSQELQKALPRLRIACIHGKMKAKEKDGIMQAVVDGKIDVLVSTTVIEVGVDVPNATLMIIENAERFGLSQLHQLRGRVGRGQAKSYCILVSDNPTQDSQIRMKAMCDTNDGFKISEADLELRGPGDFFGSKQHGLPEMRIADLCADVRVLQSAQDAAKAYLERDPKLSSPECRVLRQRINDMFDKNSAAFN